MINESSTRRPLRGLYALLRRSFLDLVRRPLYWVGFLALPLFIFLFLTTLMINGLPDRIPSGIVDKDGTQLSRSITGQLNGMQMVDITQTCNSYTEARQLMQEGKIFGYFLIPENFQADLLAGRQPVITFYTNMTYYVPASLLFKTFKTTALYAKAGVAVSVLQGAGLTNDMTGMLNPINVVTRPLNNPELNYAIYLCNSFIPCALQLMIMLITVYSLGQDIKYRRSRALLSQCDGSVIVYLVTKLLPQTVIWWIIAVFMESWLYRWNGYPMNGSWFWLTVSELMFVLASQGFALFIFCVLPNLRLGLSLCALTGILSFSIAAFSFPEQSMYGAVSIFSWLMPIRYNFLIYSEQALNGLDLYYSRVWYAAYIAYMLLPFTMLWKLKRAMKKEVYVP